MKIDLHLHTSMDKEDRINYSPKKLIDFMASKGYSILAITHHRELYFNEDLKNYALKKGILLIPGIEFRINNNDVLAYNITPEDVKKIKTLRDLKKIKRKDTLIVAAHPYYPIFGLKKELEKNIDLFDAIEYCHWYTKFNNKKNRKAVKTAEKYNLPMIANSDCHRLMQVGSNYTLLGCEKNVNSVIKAIKAGKTRIITKPISLGKYLNILFYALSNVSFKILREMILKKRI